MNITLLTIGKTNFDFVKEGLGVYEKRIGHYLTYSRVEIPALGSTSSLSKNDIKEKEGELILKKLKPTDELILLDEHGKRFTSIAWAEYLNKKMNAGCRSIVFAIGGAYGFSDKVRAAARDTLSLSDMTFSHQIIRLFFVEQLYRAMTIIKGEPYHNE